jgi:hypothetical protein
MMLQVFGGLSLIIMNINGKQHAEVSPLTAVQEKILMLLAQPKNIYIGLSKDCIELPGDFSER